MKDKKLEHLNAVTVAMGMGESISFSSEQMAAPYGWSHEAPASVGEADTSSVDREIMKGWLEKAQQRTKKTARRFFRLL